jgi:hypothetical protein
MSFRRFVVTPQGLTELRGTVYYDAVTGFHAQPQVAGDLVTGPAPGRRVSLAEHSQGETASPWPWKPQLDEPKRRKRLSASGQAGASGRAGPISTFQSAA